MRSGGKSPVTDRYCPICERAFDAFEPSGVKKRPDTLCPHCGSKKRHRLAWLFLKRRTNLFDGAPKRMLHVAPKNYFVKRFSRLPGVDYLSVDLESPLAMVRLDLTKISYEDGCFDLIYCSHVLEHIPDDRKAMAKLHRVLRPGGWALIQVPVFGETTYEDFSITTPEDRLRHFGQEDHVRKYGHDITERLRSAGFAVDEIYFQKELDREEVERYALSRLPLYYCTKS